jgi:hypothetical protein
MDHVDLRIWNISHLYIALWTASHSFSDAPLIYWTKERFMIVFLLLEVWKEMKLTVMLVGAI